MAGWPTYPREPGRASDRLLRSWWPAGRLDLLLVVAALVVIAAGMAVKFVGLDHQSLWHDELVTFVFTQQEMLIGELYRRFWQIDAHPPLYYALTHFWVTMFSPTDQVALRSFSALLAAASALVAFFAFREVLPPAGRILLAVLVSCSFGLIYYGQEARPYALLFLLSTLMLALWRRLQFGQVSSWLLAAAAIVAVPLAYTHLFGLFFAASCWSVILASAWYWRRERLRILVAGGLTGCVVSAWPILVLTNLQTIRARNETAWFGIYTDPVYLTKQTAYLLFGNPYALMLTALIALVALLRCRGAWWKCLPAAAWIALLPGFLSLLIALAVSAWFMPIISNRNLIVMFPGLYLALSVVVVRNFPARLVRIVTPVIGLFFLVPSLEGYYHVTKPQWRESARYLREEQACAGGSIRVHPFIEFGGVSLHDVYAGPGLTTEPVPGVGSDPQRAIETAANDVEGAGNDCGVLLWFVPMTAADHAAIEWPQHGVEVKHFFNAAVMVRK